MVWRRDQLASTRRQLVNADGRLDVHHVVFKAALGHVIVLVPVVAETPPCIPGEAVKRKDFGPADVLFRSRQDHSAFTGDDVLGHIEAEAAELAEGPRLEPVVLGFDGMGAVFDQDEAVPAHDGKQRIHLAGPSRQDAR